MTDSTSRPSSLDLVVRERVPWLRLVGIFLIVVMTLGNAAANMLPHHVPTARELQRAEQNAMIEARRERIAVLVAQGDGCRVDVARELARALVFDGRSAVAYADDYERRCGTDAVVRRWGDHSVRLLRKRAR